MTQEDVMNFLDSHKGEVFTPKQILEGINNKVNFVSLYKALKQITKRREYFMILNYVPSNQSKGCRQCYPVTAYGAREINKKVLEAKRWKNQ